MANQKPKKVMQIKFKEGVVTVIAEYGVGIFTSTNVMILRDLYHAERKRVPDLVRWTDHPTASIIRLYPNKSGDEILELLRQELIKEGVPYR